jgi:ADP-ribosylglycohydrolase
VTDFEKLPSRQPSQEPPLERWYPFGVQPENIEGFHPLGRWSREDGVYTDDMRYRLMACQAILRKGGPITGQDLADEWLNYRLMVEGADMAQPTLSWEGPQQAYARIMASTAQLTDMMQQHRACRSGWDAPLGLIYAADPEGAARDGYAVAVAVATALTPNAQMDQVVDNVLTYADSLGNLSNEFRGRVKRLIAIAEQCENVFALREPFYHEFLVTFPPWDAVFTLEMVPCALALCLIAKGDPEQAIIGATNMGRDSDTIAAIAGEICGALRGAESFPKAWTDQVVSLNPQPDLAQMAADLSALIMKRAKQRQQQLEALIKSNSE